MKQGLREHAVRGLRRAGLLPLYDRLKYAAARCAAAAANRRFQREYPGFAVPPPALAYDAYGHVNWRDYRASGLRHAGYLAGLLREFQPAGPRRVLEWGCGPARVIRHLPGLLPPPLELVGSDFNPQTIAWCRRQWPDLRFEENGLRPPLPFPAGHFDAVYGLSVITHLSMEMHAAWRDELLRALRPGGLLILTAHGDFYRDRHLLPAERQRYEAGELVVRAGVEEGKKWFAAFHSPLFMREHFLAGLDILRHQTRPLPGSMEQDVWVARKR